MASDVVRTIRQQIGSLKPSCRFIQIDDHTLRVHNPKRKETVNIDVKYNHGIDLYDVTVHRFKSDLVIKTNSHCGLFVDAMVELVKSLVMETKNNVNKRIG